MKFNKLIHLAIFLICTQHINAQDPNFSVKWGQEFEASGKSSLDDIIGYDATGIYAVKVRSHNMGGPSYTLDHYDNNFAPTKSFDLDIEEDGKECDVIQLIQLKNKLYMFYSYQDKKEKKNRLFVDEIDKSTLQPKKQKKKIGSIDYYGNSKWNSGTVFHYRF
jgi:hypothetical protein